MFHWPPMLVLLFLLVGMSHTPCRAQNAISEFYAAHTRIVAQQSFALWQAVSAAQNVSALHVGPTRAAPTMDSKTRAEVRERAIASYLEQIVPAMHVSPSVAHLAKERPVTAPSSTPDAGWFEYYLKTKNRLRPMVPYKWNSNATRDTAVITLTEDHVDTLQENYDYLIWYRDQLDRQGEGSQHAGARHFRQFLDCTMADILAGLPSAPRIRLETGQVEAPRWELNERNLREQLVMAYRYLIAKYMIYAEYEQFAPADRELLLSLMKIACLLGCRLEADWFDTLEIRLDQAGTRTRRKKPMSAAMRDRKSVEEGKSV